MAEKRGFFAELRRRHVWRVAVAYAATAWLLLQLASIVLPSFGAPDWVMRVVLAILVVCFPIAILLAWAYELTPEGMRRTRPADSPEAREPGDTRMMGRRLNALIMTVLAIAVIVLLGNQFVWHRGMTDADDAAVPAKSIAVLPFENLSSDPQNDYFVSGMQDLILTKLASIGELKVISRTSTMQYKSRPGNLKQIAAELGVATILEGSVQKQGNRALINVQLIDARTDRHLWAHNYTRTLDDIFGVEGEVAEKIAAALHATLSPQQTAQLATAPTQNKTALDAFLRAEYLANQGDVNYDTASWKAAIPLYRRAIAEDPGFALAQARLSWAESSLAWFGGGEDAEVLAASARSDAQRARERQPDLAAAHVAMGYSDYWGEGDYAAALKAFEAALALRPNDPSALAARGYVERRQGHFDDAVASLKQAVAHDPRNSKLVFEVGHTLMLTGQYSEAEAWLQRALALDPDNASAKFEHSNAILYGSGDVPRALGAAQGDDPLLKYQRIGLLSLQRRFAEAIALLEGIPDTPDNFPIASGSKDFQLANLYRLSGDAARARPLFRRALDVARAQFDRQPAADRALALQNIAGAEIGVGDAAGAMASVAEVEAMVAQMQDVTMVPAYRIYDAQIYAAAGRADLAVPLVARALATPGVSFRYSPVLLWLDPYWDPIRDDPGFQALLQQYGKFKPAVTYAVPPPS